MTQHVNFAGLSDRGQVRQRNEDRWFANPDTGVFLVTDGMGGHEAGDVAAEVVVQFLPDIIGKHWPVNVDKRSELISAIEQSLLEHNTMMRDCSEKHLGFIGMGATVVVAILYHSDVLIGHLGDSRGYLIRKGSFRQLTKDHSLVQILLDEGELDPEQASSHPSHGQVTRFVGMDDPVLPDVQIVETQASDRLLLCSDGVTNMISDEEILEIASDGRVEIACQNIVDSANRAGGVDNITALVVEIL